MVKPKPELISFNVCPFVQRSVITLLEKDVDFKISHIDLFDTPEWFEKISPLRKVPVLRVGQTVLFESAVINEYLDELNPPSLFPEDPLLRAQNRAWIEFGSDMIMNHYKMTTAKSKLSFIEYRDKLISQFEYMERELEIGPYFNGNSFSLVDAAFAPLFMRIDILEGCYASRLFAKNSRIDRWCFELLTLHSVKNSVTPDFAEVYLDFVRSMDSHFSHLIAISAPSPTMN